MTKMQPIKKTRTQTKQDMKKGIINNILENGLEITLWPIDCGQQMSRGWIQKKSIFLDKNYKLGNILPNLFYMIEIMKGEKNDIRLCSMQARYHEDACMYVNDLYDLKPDTYFSLPRRVSKNQHRKDTCMNFT